MERSTAWSFARIAREADRTATPRARGMARVRKAGRTATAARREAKAKAKAGAEDSAARVTATAVRPSLLPGRRSNPA